MENRRIKVGDWVISNQEDPYVAASYSWISCPIDTPVQVVDIRYNEMSATMGNIVVLVNNRTLSLDIRRFKLYNKYTNTKLLSGGNI